MFCSLLPPKKKYVYAPLCLTSRNRNLRLTSRNRNLRLTSRNRNLITQYSRAISQMGRSVFRAFCFQVKLLYERVRLSLTKSVTHGCNCFGLYPQQYSFTKTIFNYRKSQISFSCIKELLLLLYIADFFSIFCLSVSLFDNLFI